MLRDLRHSISQNSLVAVPTAFIPQHMHRPTLARRCSSRGYCPYGIDRHEPSRTTAWQPRKWQPRKWSQQRSCGCSPFAEVSPPRQHKATHNDDGSTIFLSQAPYPKPFRMQEREKRECEVLLLQLWYSHLSPSAGAVAV